MHPPTPSFLLALGILLSSSTTFLALAEIFPSSTSLSISSTTDTFTTFPTAAPSNSSTHFLSNKTSTCNHTMPFSNSSSTSLLPTPTRTTLTTAAPSLGNGTLTALPTTVSIMTNILADTGMPQPPRRTVTSIQYVGPSGTAGAPPATSTSAKNAAGREKPPGMLGAGIMMLGMIGWISVWL